MASGSSSQQNEYSSFNQHGTEINLKEDFCITLFGDPQQLQPFNGDLFNQAIESRVIPHVELTEDRRRTNTNGTLFKSMKALADGKPEEFQFGEDCHFISGTIPEVLSIVAQLARTNSGKDITVVCPYNATNDELNVRLQEIFVPHNNGSIRDAFGKIWKVGARVMMLVNHDDVGIYNGEEGEIVGATLGMVKVQFHRKGPGEIVDIPTFLPVSLDNMKADSEIEEPLSTKHITLSWAVTPDKAQGSEWKYCICYFPPEKKNTGFVHKKRVYTALSRTSRELFVVTDYEATVRQMFITEPPPRYDNLGRRLRGIPFVPEYIDPMILSQMIQSHQ